MNEIERFFTEVIDATIDGESDDDYADGGLPYSVSFFSSLTFSFLELKDHNYLGSSSGPRYNMEPQQHFPVMKNLSEREKWVIIFPFKQAYFRLH